MSGHARFFHLRCFRTCCIWCELPRVGAPRQQLMPISLTHCTTYTLRLTVSYRLPELARQAIAEEFNELELPHRVSQAA